MNKILLIAMLLTLSTGMAIAQNQPGSGQGPGGHGKPGNAYAGNHGDPVDRLTEQLGLTEAQVIAISAIFEDNQILRDEERERSRAIACENRATTHALVLAELTPDQVILFEEQRAKREELKQAMEEVRQAHGGGGFGGGRGMMDCDS
jgi:Spy/CpxP family protein refolding chaperone